jgi:hypothetical protein
MAKDPEVHETPSRRRAQAKHRDCLRGREGKVITEPMVGVTSTRQCLCRDRIDWFSVGTLTTNCVGAVSLGHLVKTFWSSACVRVVLSESGVQGRRWRHEMAMRLASRRVSVVGSASRHICSNRVSAPPQPTPSSRRFTAGLMEEATEVESGGLSGTTRSSSGVHIGFCR